MQNLAKRKNRLTAALTWAGAAALLLAALLWYALDDRPRPIEEAPLDRAALGAEQAGLDVNAATAEELGELPGIGPVLAERIIAWREENGPFTGREDLLSVSGIGPALWEDIAPYIEF